MNNTFNIKRFAWLFKKTILERPAQLLGMTCLTLVVVLLIYAILKSLAPRDVVQNGSFMIGLAGGGSFLASFVFNYFSSNAAGSSYLTLPASHFEKWLCAVLISVVLFTIIFLVFYRITDAAFVASYHRSLDTKGPFNAFFSKAIGSDVIKSGDISNTTSEESRCEILSVSKLYR